MRVLQLVIGLDVGGLEDVVVNLINHLARRGVACHLGCLAGRGVWGSRCAPQGVWEGNLPARRKCAALWSLCAYLRRNGIGLINCHNRQAFLYAVAASFLTGVPLVYTRHGREWARSRKWIWLDRALLRFTAGIVGVSSDITDLVVRLEKIPASKVRLIRNGIDAERFVPPVRERAEIRRRLGIPEQAFVVGSVGRFSREKKYASLIRSFARFRAGARSAALVLVGDGPERQELARLARDAGLAECVRMPGMQDDVVPWLQSLDVFCLSSSTEGTSISLLEACSVGLPVLVTDVGGNPEIVRDGGTGLLAPASDEEAFARGLARLLADGSLRRELGRAARERVRDRYSAERMAQEYLNFYRELAGADRGSEPGSAGAKKGLSNGPGPC